MFGSVVNKNPITDISEELQRSVVDLFMLVSMTILHSNPTDLVMSGSDVSHQTLSISVILVTAIHSKIIN